MKIVSGGQTGVDRGALDAALETGTQAGGWCPEGRLAEDGPIASRYPLTELAGAGYRERTRQNVLDSDATLIIHFGPLSGGTRYTHACCVELEKPVCLVDGTHQPLVQPVEQVCRFIEECQVGVLNVAGPRASGETRAYDVAKQLLVAVLQAG